MGIGAVIAAALLMTQVAQARPAVRISGEVIRPENNDAPVTIVVRDEQGDTIWKRTSYATRFSMKLPGDRMYTMAFSQPKCIQKDVVIDARHAHRHGSGMKVRKVFFQVMLELDHEADLRYAGPVGTIGFDPHSGQLRVDHRYALVRDRDELEKP